MEGSTENEKQTPSLPERSMRHNGVIIQQANNNELFDTTTTNKWCFVFTYLDTNKTMSFVFTYLRWHRNLGSL